jgi:hypothetical protein
MITRNRIKFSEKQAALIWQQVAGNELTSTEDELVKIIYPGRINGDSGPDFRDAVIVSGFRLTKGDIEIHVKSSDWYSHKHHADAEYNGVILHVAMWHDCNSITLLQSGKPIPLLCLSKALRHQAYLLPYTLPCFSILDHIGRHSLKKILDTAGEQRLKQKAMHFQADIPGPALRPLSVGEVAGQVLFRGIMRALGYAKNTEPFEDLAHRLPLNLIESRKGLAMKQALLLGTAGLLPSQRRQPESVREKEVEELELLWQSAGKKIESMNEGDWNLSHIYPNNSPVRRIIAQSYLLERYSDGRLLASILQLVRDAPQRAGHETVRNGLTVAGDGYWRDHFDLGVRSKTKISAILGNSKAGELVVNVVLPFALSWGELANDAKLTENAIELYLNYPKLAENCITRHMKKQLGLEEPFGLFACHQQGLIHIFRNYCREGRCAQCPLVE